MKALRLVLLASVCILIVGSLRAQVKIGDNKLDLGAERLLEIERAGELLIVTDSLELGLTDNQNLNITTDALMLKLLNEVAFNLFKLRFQGSLQTTQVPWDSFLRNEVI